MQRFKYDHTAQTVIYFSLPRMILLLELIYPLNVSLRPCNVYSTPRVAQDGFAFEDKRAAEFEALRADDRKVRGERACLRCGTKHRT